MSRKDSLTGKVSVTGNNRSKAMNITKRDWKFNIQTISFIDRKGKRIRLVTSAKNIRTIKRKKLVL